MEIGGPHWIPLPFLFVSFALFVSFVLVRISAVYSGRDPTDQAKVGSVTRCSRTVVLRREVL